MEDIPFNRNFGNIMNEELATNEMPLLYPFHDCNDAACNFCNNQFTDKNAEPLNDHIIQHGTNDSLSATESNPFFEKNAKFKLMLKNIADSVNDSLESSFNETSLDAESNCQTNRSIKMKDLLSSTETSKNFVDSKDFLDIKEIKTEKSLGSLDNFEMFMEHIENDSKVKYKCRVCNKIFNLMRQANKHISIHTTEPQFICSICNKYFLNQQTFSRHCTKNHPGESDETCKKLSSDENYCSSTVIGTKSLGTKRYSCKICQKSFKTKGYIKLHLLIHDNKFPHSCTECKQPFRFSSSLMKHYHKFHEKIAFDKRKSKRKQVKPGNMVKKKVPPTKNKSKFNSRKINHSKLQEQTSLNILGENETRSKLNKTKSNKLVKKKINSKCSKPQRLHVKINKPAAKCKNKKQKAFLVQTGIQKLPEGKMPKLQEEQCHDLNGNKQSNFHDFIEYSAQNKAFACKICKKLFSYKQSANDHISLHTKELKFKCMLCPKTFFSRHSRLSHKLSHFYVIKYLCYICKKLFNDKGYRDIYHMTTHVQMNLYTCHVCDKMFETPNHHGQHVNTHSGKKSYCCTLCKKKFIKNEDLEIHSIICTQDRLYYECSICEENFSSKSYCHKHLRSKHNTKC